MPEGIGRVGQHDGKKTRGKAQARDGFDSAGTDAAQLEAALAFLRANADYHVERAAATLEDVFISLMPESADAPQ